MAKKLFCGGLAWATDSESLNDAFSKFGDVVEATVVTDRQTGQSRGFGFVTFANDDAADAAIQAMDGAELDGRRISVRVAEERGGGRGGFGGGGRGGFGGGRGGGGYRGDRGGYGGGDRGGYGGGDRGGYGGGRGGRGGYGGGRGGGGGWDDDGGWR